MKSPLKSAKLRLVISTAAIFVVFFALISRLGYLQIVRGAELEKKALEQWARDTMIQPERGVIYDRKGVKRLAISLDGYKIECITPEVKDPEATAERLSDFLEMDKDEIHDLIISNERYVKLADWVDKEVGDKLDEEKINGIVVVPNSKRYYPMDNLASYVIGFTNTDIGSKGMYGIEASYDEYLRGTPGRMIINTDIWGRQLPYDNELVIDAKPGNSIILTIDETIQHFAEKAATQGQIDNSALRTTVLVMEPNTGDILAMASKPDYNLNSPRIATDTETMERWKGLTQEELVEEWYALWKPHPITDIYEPGSTFKVITAAAALEENLVTPNSQFTSHGFIDVPGGTLRCWRYKDPHGDQTLSEAMQNSCNPVFVEIAFMLGQEKMMNYVEAFGFGEKTGIDLSGEAKGIIPDNSKPLRDIRLGTVSYGQGISVTPLQLLSAFSAIANDGVLMQPRIVKNVIDDEGKINEEFKPQQVRKVISQETSQVLLNMLESVVNEGSGKQAYVPGYRVGGKTGTAEKPMNGEYSEDRFIASFVGIAPVNDPKVVVLVIVDEPNPDINIYGGKVAAPIAGKVIEETLKYLNVEPQFN